MVETMIHHDRVAEFIRRTLKKKDVYQREGWNTIPLDKPVILVDERNQAGSGKKGTSSKTFSMVATVSHDPKRLKKIYDKHDPGFDSDGNKIELKYGGASTINRKKLLKRLVSEDVVFTAETLEKTDPNLPKEYSPKNGRDVYRRMARDIVTDAMKTSKKDEFNVYFDNHTSLTKNATDSIIAYASEESKKKCCDVRALKSADEPLLQIHDFPTGAVGENAEDGIEEFRKIIKSKLNEEVIGCRTK